MKRTYTHFIAQNIAPRGAKSVGVYRDGKKVLNIPLGGLTPPDGEPLYSFGVISDLHISHSPYVAWKPVDKLNSALTAFESYGCAFCVATGDLTNTGFYLREDEATAGTEYLDYTQFSMYSETCGKHTIPVYELCGNHESYYGMPIANNMDKLESYTGSGELYYTITQGDDLFILLGQPNGSAPMGADGLTWLERTLAANTDKRCFVFVHPHLGSGNPVGAYTSNPIFTWWGAANTNRFETALRNHGNAILFHGHTHAKFQTQEQDDVAIYAWTGYHSIHVPSLGVPRDVVNGVLQGRDGESYCYIVDVYANGIHLRGYDVINKAFLSIGSYWLNT